MGSNRRYKCSKKTKQLEDSVRKLEKDLREADESNYKRVKLISQLMDDNKQLELDNSVLKSKVERLEEELDILRSERKEIEEKTKDGIDKDAVIVQLILEKDRLAIENLKNHANMIEQKKIALEAARLANQRQICQMPYFPPGGITWL